MTDSDFSNHGTHDMQENPTPTTPEPAASPKKAHSSREGNNNKERFERNARLASYFLVGIAVIFGPVLAISGLQANSPSTPLYLSYVAVTFVLALNTLRMLRRGKNYEGGIYLLLAALNLIMIVDPIFVAGGSTRVIMLMPLAGLVAYQTLTWKKARLLIGFSILSAIASLAIDAVSTRARATAIGSEVRGFDSFLYVVICLAILLVAYYGFRPSFIWFMNRPIRTKMIGLVVSLSLLTVGILFAINITTTREDLITNAVDEMSSFASSRADVYVEMLADRVNTMNAFAMVAANSPILTAQNEGYQGSINSIQAQIQEKDSQWISANDYDALIRGVLANDLAYNAKRFKEINQEMFVEVFITDRYGANVAAADRTSDYNQADENWWQAAYNGGEGAIYIGDVEYDDSAGIWGFNIAVPIYSQTTNKLAGILRTTASFDQFFGLMGKELSETASANIMFPSGLSLDEEGGLHTLAGGDVGTTIREGELYLEMPEMQMQLSENDLQTLASYVVNPSGTPVGAALFTQYCKSCHLNNVPAIANYDQAYEIITSGGHHATSPVGGENLYTSSAALSSELYPFVENTGWRLIIYEPESAIIGPVQQQTLTLILLAIGVAAVIAGIAAFIAQRIANPIINLTNLASELASGNYDVLAEVTTTDEVGQLSSAFNMMAGEVSQRDKELVARARAAETSAEVSRRLSTILNRDQLVTEVVEQLQQAFGYYHAHIYLIDENTQELVMVGGTGEPGRQMLAAGHKIPWGRGLTGRAAESNAAVLVPDTTQEEDWLPNPLLPETKAEIAVPISVGDRVLGVLDVQQNEIGALDEDDQTLLVSIAGQVAIALQNIRLMDEAQSRAKRQTLIYEITQRIQGATSVKDAMQIAVREVGRALDVEETKVKLS